MNFDPTKYNTVYLMRQAANKICDAGDLDFGAALAARADRFESLLARREYRFGEDELNRIEREVLEYLDSHE